MKLPRSVLVPVNKTVVEHICVIIFQLTKHVFAFKDSYSFALFFLVSTNNTDLLIGKESTVKPLNKGHFGTAAFVLSLEVVLFLEVVDFLLFKSR